MKLRRIVAVTGSLAFLVLFATMASRAEDDNITAPKMSKPQKMWLQSNITDDLVAMPNEEDTPIRNGSVAARIISGVSDSKISPAVEYYVATRQKAKFDADAEKILASQSSAKEVNIVQESVESLKEKIFKQGQEQDKKIQELSLTLEKDKRTKLLVDVIHDTLPGWRARNLGAVQSPRAEGSNTPNISVTYSGSSPQYVGGLLIPSGIVTSTNYHHRNHNFGDSPIGHNKATQLTPQGHFGHAQKPIAQPPIAISQQPVVRPSHRLK